MTVTPYDGCGAEVTGVHLATVADPVFEQILHAWWEHGVLVFPGQHLSEDEQIAFSLRFGALERLVSKAKAASVGSQPQIGKLSNVGKDGKPVAGDSSLALFLRGNQYWHTDSSFKRIPAKASLLSAWHVPSEGGETEWADARAAYDSLSPEAKRYWADKVAVHWYWFSQSLVGGTDVLSEDEWAALPPVEHPVVRRHPDSGRTQLFVGRHACQLVGLNDTEGRRQLAELTEFVAQPQRVHTHRWAKGDLVLWDNRCMLHRGRPWPEAEARVMKRTTIAGDGDNEWALGEV